MRSVKLVRIKRNMKTKRNILAVLVTMAISTLLFAACSSNNDENENTIINIAEVIGLWTCTESIDKMNGQSATGIMVGKTVIVYADGRFTSNASTIGNGTWVLCGNQISAKNTYGDTFNVSLKVSGNTMNWDGTSTRGVSFNYTWRKK